MKTKVWTLHIGCQIYRTRQQNQLFRVARHAKLQLSGANQQQLTEMNNHKQKSRKQN